MKNSIDICEKVKYNKRNDVEKFEKLWFSGLFYCCIFFLGFSYRLKAWEAIKIKVMCWKGIYFMAKERV